MNVLELAVADSKYIAPDIREIVLRRISAGQQEVLPSYIPGSHIVIECGGRANAYSLTGSGDSPEEYRISVQLRPDGRGGSSAVHRFRHGERVKVSGPRSAFPPVATARRHLLIAGGIGITPILSHLRAAAAWGREAELLYSFRPGHAAHLEDIRALCGSSPSLFLMEFTERKAFRTGLAEALRRQPLGTHLHVCGPLGFMDSVIAEARSACWPESRLHLEAFGAADLDPGKPFTAHLARTGRSVDVPSGTSLLEALENSGVPVPNLCRQGVCGECRIPVSKGRPEHRDLYLSESDKAANTTIMCCVSRSHEPHLELEL
ncbi:PDR/VanB family oxidoreductase [Arthrobacter cavernae]|uniref:Oxidoreductase n=1 Tax=Arthrobacter cavernae TaxID=2817681 RepID=A0A939HF97_9MICC|nr:PDR/VanB family oxidoreductase [Arthrobacter cavernae]MBO1267273.1 oxidoreductase [Arthrobacter cavernae]